MGGRSLCELRCVPAWWSHEHHGCDGEVPRGGGVGGKAFEFGPPRKGLYLDSIGQKRDYASAQGLLQPQVHSQFGVSTQGLQRELRVARNEARDEFHGKYKSMWIKEKEVPGQLYSVEKPTVVRPDRLHAPLQGEPGDRVVVIGYTVSKWEKLYDHQCEDLMELGFVLPERGPKVRMFGQGDPRPPVPPVPSSSTMDSTRAPDTGTTAVSGASFLGPGSSSDSTLQRPQSEDHMDVSSSTPGPMGQVSSSSNSSRRQRVDLPEMGGQRLDSMVVPGGRVELSLRWAIRYCPNSSQENVVMTSTPLMPLGHEEEQRMRSRVTWLSEFVEEERQIRRAKEERGEFASQRERQLFYKLDEAIDYMNEILSVSENTRQQNQVNLMRMAVGDGDSERVEEMLQALTKPLETVHTVDLQEVRRHLPEWTQSIEKEMGTLQESGTLKEMPLQEAKDRAAAAGELVLVPSKTVLSTHREATWRRRWALQAPIKDRHLRQLPTQRCGGLHGIG